MVLHKPDYNSNDYELPNKKATPSILAIEVWLMKLHVVWAFNRIPYYSNDNCASLSICRLTVSLKNQRRLIFDDRYLVGTCTQVQCRSNMHEIKNACMFVIKSTRA